MTHHSHRFVETYDGLVGYGLNRETNENTLIYYLQKFSDDKLMAVIKDRLSDADIDGLFEMISRMLHEHLNEEEYHQLFLKEDRQADQNE